MNLPIRRLIIVLGDQLDPDSPVLADFDPDQDLLWMAEVEEEATHVWSHKARLVLFLSAMRHYAEIQRARGWNVHYRSLGEHPARSLAEALSADLKHWCPQQIILVEPGDWRVRESLHQVLGSCGIDWTELPDPHFLVSLEEFGRWAEGRREFRLEHFYRYFRKRLDVLMDGNQPEGGRWNFDADNRGSFDARGPGLLQPPLRFEPDAITREVVERVNEHYADHPGDLAAFDWPTTPIQALEALNDFVEHRLVAFGRYQDSMWSGEPWLYHARISSALNLKLLNPRVVIEAAVNVWRQGKAPIQAVEGFVRQILGWREYVRGIYWQRMPEYLSDNALGANQPLPEMYWSGKTEMRCMSEALGQTLRLGYAHHIQRLMVTGLFALLLGVRPREVHEWYLAVYVDAVEWVELPNTIGMSQYADGGFMASKPYCASGKYIQRMSNYCAGCRFDPAVSTGPRACPMTTLYWDFLIRHESRFARHPRTALQWKHLARLDDDQRQAIGQAADQLRAALAPAD